MYTVEGAGARCGKAVRRWSIRQGRETGDGRGPSLDCLVGTALTRRPVRHSDLRTRRRHPTRG
jgi:hypothetical protein